MAREIKIGLILGSGFTQPGFLVCTRMSEPCLQCSVTVGWVTGRVPDLHKVLLQQLPQVHFLGTWLNMD